jgi:hypothetical protein
MTNGLGIGQNDCWIAAAARATDALLLTNDRDFDPLEGRFIRRAYVGRRTGLSGSRLPTPAPG